MSGYDNEVINTIRNLELQNEAKAQNLTSAYQQIATLEERLRDLSNQIADLTNVDTSYVGNESQIDFIKKIAASRTKFAKEAQDIVDAVENTVETPAEPEVEVPVDTGTENEQQ